MKTLRSKTLIGLLIGCFILTLAGVAVADDEMKKGDTGMMRGDNVSLTGQVQGDQFIDEAGKMYQLKDNDMFQELNEHEGERITIEGAVTEDMGKTVLEVKSYEVVGETKSD